MKMYDCKKDLAIIVYSCYKNRDMWGAFSFFYKKYCKDPICKIFLVTDKYEPNEEYVFDEIVEIDDSWAKMIRTAIIKAGTPYVMLFMDDYFLDDFVEYNDLYRFVDDIKKHHAQNIRLRKTPFKKSVFENDSKYYKIELGTAYCFSTQVGIWDSTFLINYLKDDMSAWEFERVGSMEANNQNILILESKEYEYPYIETVRKGKWMRVGVKHCKNNHYCLDYSVRQKTSLFEEVILYVKKVILIAFPNIVQKMQNKILYSK